MSYKKVLNISCNLLNTALKVKNSGFRGTHHSHTQLTAHWAWRTFEALNYKTRWQHSALWSIRGLPYWLPGWLGPAACLLPRTSITTLGKDKNLKYCFYWMFIAFPSSKNWKIVSQTIVKSGSLCRTSEQPAHLGRIPSRLLENVMFPGLSGQGSSCLQISAATPQASCLGVGLPWLKPGTQFCDPFFP